MYYYAAWNQYSTETSMGIGDDGVASFDSRSARDAWVWHRPLWPRERLRAEKLGDSPGRCSATIRATAAIWPTCI